MVLGFILVGSAVGLAGAVLSLALGGGPVLALAAYSGFGAVAVLALAAGHLRTPRAA